MSIIDGYNLFLDDGNNWWIGADRDNTSLSDEFARIMCLQKSEHKDSSKFIFSDILSKNNGKIDINETFISYFGMQFNERDWKCHDSNCIRVWSHKEKSVLLCEAKYRDYKPYVYLSLWYSTRPIYTKSVLLGGIPFHASSAELNGKAVLFVAPGGTGKSTCYKRLPDYWGRLSDDESLVVLNKNGQYRLHPFPTWSEYLYNKAKNTWNVGYSVPVSAIFFLVRSDFDDVMPIKNGEAAFSINRSATQVFRHYWLDEDKESQIICKKKLFLNSCEMACKIPAFILQVSLDGRFWKKVEKVID